MTVRPGLLPALLVALALPACERAERATAFPKAPVILISIDTLRADRLPAYGYSAVETPNLDALARDAMLFESAWSHCPMTLPAHASMLTGLLPTEHGVRNNLGYRFDATAHETLPAFLRRHGYATGAAVSSYVLRADTGLGDAFEFFDDAIPVATAGAASQHQRPGSATLAIARSWIGTHRDDPFFFMFHIYEPHAPYAAPEPFRARYAAEPYDGEVAASDAIVGELLAFLKTSGIYDRAIVIVTSDHGEGLWDHGEDQHGILLYREALQVPLFVKLPGGERAGERVAAPVGLIDLFPTVAALVGLEAPPAVQGIAMTSIGADDPPRRLYAETFYPRIHLGWSELRALVDGRHHYIDAPQAELYDLAADPRETRDIASAERRVTASMRQAMEAYPKGIAALGQIDPEDAKKLAALGYLGSVSARGAGAALPNPRAMLPWLARMKSAFALADQRRYGEAVAALRALVAENPRLFDAQDKLGELLAAMGDYEGAIEVYRDAMSRAERFSPEMALSLGDAYLSAGQPAEAARYADLAMKSIPPGAHALRARIALERGDLAAAETAAAAAIGTSNPQPSMMLLQVEVKRARGDLEGALAAANAAEARARSLGVPALYRLDFLRGDLLARLDRPAEAEAAYRREIENFPQHAQAYANLAVIYFIEGKRDAMNRMMEAMVAANPHPGAYALAARTLEALDDPAGAARWRRRASEAS
jgi:arylsulfatase A-like enzyme/predicted negative regulator of RcsB-dependent stress response